jgi:hypothetical protein
VSRNDQGSVRFLFGGLNNRIKGTQSPSKGVAVELTAAQNVTITDSYGIKSRPGFGSALRDFDSAHSVWSDGDTFLLFVGDEYVYRYSDGSFSAIFALSDGSKRVFYEQFGSVVVFSDGEDIATLENSESTASTIDDPDQDFKSAFPAARHLKEFNGRLYGATSAGLIWSDTYHLAIDRRNFLLPLGGDIKMVAPVKGGIFVSGNGKTLFLAGTGPEDFVSRTVLRQATIDGAYCQTDAAYLSDELSGTAVVFVTKEGVFAGTDDGQIFEITRKKYQVGDYSSGSVVIDTTDTQAQIIVSLTE